MNSQDILSFQEAYLSVYEGRIPWDDKNRPLRSGWRPLPKEKMANKLAWKSRERSNPNRDELKLKKQMNKISDILINYHTKESYEIINYLVNEGYAETPESAYIIMENMSEGWKSNVKKVIRGAGEITGATVSGIGGKKTSSTNPLARAANATTRVAKKSISKSKFAKKAKRFAKYTTLGLVGGALLN